MRVLTRKVWVFPGGDAAEGAQQVDAPGQAPAHLPRTHASIRELSTAHRTALTAVPHTTHSTQRTAAYAPSAPECLAGRHAPRHMASRSVQGQQGRVRAGGHRGGADAAGREHDRARHHHGLALRGGRAERGREAGRDSAAAASDHGRVARGAEELDVPRADLRGARHPEAAAERGQGLCVRGPRADAHHAAGVGQPQVLPGRDGAGAEGGAGAAQRAAGPHPAQPRELPRVEAHGLPALLLPLQRRVARGARADAQRPGGPALPRRLLRRHQDPRLRRPAPGLPDPLRRPPLNRHLGYGLRGGRVRAAREEPQGERAHAGARRGGEGVTLLCWGVGGFAGARRGAGLAVGGGEKDDGAAAGAGQGGAARLRAQRQVRCASVGGGRLSILLYTSKSPFESKCLSQSRWKDVLTE
eukprot:1132305-Rhodomonas_salina.1